MEKIAASSHHLAGAEREGPRRDPEPPEAAHQWQRTAHTMREKMKSSGEERIEGWTGEVEDQAMGEERRLAEELCGRRLPPQP